MARYLCSFTIVVSVDELRQLLVEVLQASNFDMLYNTSDYVMAREIPGKVPFAKLVTVEVLIDRTGATETEVRINCVVKNEELPLQVDNHCYQMFKLIYQAIADNRHWQVVESVTG